MTISRPTGRQYTTAASGFWRLTLISGLLD
jgi:hypothetical protein